MPLLIIYNNNFSDTLSQATEKLAQMRGTMDQLNELRNRSSKLAKNTQTHRERLDSLTEEVAAFSSKLQETKLITKGVKKVLRQGRRINEKSKIIRTFPKFILDDLLNNLTFNYF